MKSKLLLASFLACQIGGWIVGADAATIKYTAPIGDQAGKFEGDLPLKSIGSIKLPNGAAVFQDDQLKIMAVPDWLFDRNVVLSGPVIRAEFAAQGNNQVIGGLAYFLEGEWLNNLASPRAADVIEMVSGERIHGRILSRMGNALAIKPDREPTRKVEFSSIKNISSARAFRFSIPTSDAKVAPPDNSISAEADTIVLTPTFLKGAVLASRPTVPKSTLPGADPGISKGTIGTFIALDVVNQIAPAIVIPLVLQRSTQQAAINAQRGFVFPTEQ